jgi:thiamine kinase-like enzyme
METVQMEKLLEAWMKRQADFFGLNRKTLKATYIWNPGGFVNLSFLVSDGITRLHMKLADQIHAPQLKQWFRHHTYLESNYFAPKLIKIIEEEIIPGRPTGLIFSYFAGVTLEASAHKEHCLEKALQILSQLHRDSKLQSNLDSGISRLCSDVFVDMYISRFREDLEAIHSGRDLLTFVSDETIAWFQDEIDELEQTVRESAAFNLPAVAVVHNDLNWNNILVSEDAELCLIDWDDLAANGDPMLDYSVLIWPTQRAGDASNWLNLVHSLVGEEDARRVPIYFRAALLDEVIDILADYIDAEQYPMVKAEAQERARRTHLQALSSYMDRYGRSANST